METFPKDLFKMVEKSEEESGSWVMRGNGESRRREPGYLQEVKTLMRL